MKLSTSTGDLLREVGATDKAIEAIATVFRHINVELGEDGDIAYDFGSAWDAYVADIGAALRKTGAEAVLAHSVTYKFSNASYEEIVECARRDVRACEKLGIPDCVVHPISTSDMSAKEMYRFNKQFYLDIFSGVKGTPVHVLTENGGDSEQRSNMLSSGQDLRDFVEYVDHPLLGVCWDVSHCNLNHPPRNDQYVNITALGKHLRALHVADNYGVGHYHHHTFPLAGVINFDSVLCALLDIGYKGAFNFEASYTIRQPQMMPVGRNEWKPPEGRKLETRIKPSKAVKLKAVELLYEIGKFMLEAYDVFEE